MFTKPSRSLKEIKLNLIFNHFVRNLGPKIVFSCIVVRLIVAPPGTMTGFAIGFASFLIKRKV